LLRELRKSKSGTNGTNELSKRWFFCQEIDLVFWVGADGIPKGFQLAYDKYIGEKSFSWHIDHGYHQYVVDDGEEFPAQKETPLLREVEKLDSEKVLNIFLENKGDLPDELAGFVIATLKSHQT